MKIFLFSNVPQLHEILHELGFDFNKQDSRKTLVERADIVLWRRKYLRQIKEYREANKTIYYLQLSRRNLGKRRTCKNKSMVDTTVKNKR